MSGSDKITDLITLLYTSYATPELGMAGEEMPPPPADAVMDMLNDAEKTAALAALGHFCDFCRDYLRTNSVQSTAYLAQGLGLVLANGVRVALAPSDENEIPGATEAAHDVPVTAGLRARQGIAGSQSIPVSK